MSVGKSTYKGSGQRETRIQQEVEEDGDRAGTSLREMDGARRED